MFSDLYNIYINMFMMSYFMSQLQDSMRELDEQLQEPFKHSCTQLDARNQLENSRPVLQELHSSHDQCRGYGKQFLEMALSKGEHSDNSHDHISRYIFCIVVSLIFVTQPPTEISGCNF